MADFDSSNDSVETSDVGSGASSVESTAVDVTSTTEVGDPVDVSGRVESTDAVDVSGRETYGKPVSVVESENYGASVDVTGGDKKGAIVALEGTGKMGHEAKDAPASKESVAAENAEIHGAKQDAELVKYLETESPYSPEVNAYISSKEELEVYKEAGLVERNINGRPCLIRGDLDMEYYHPQSRKTNAELIAAGRVPIDPETGEKIELHHMNQDFNGPFVELKTTSEHDVKTKVLHTSEEESWRRDPDKRNQYNAQRRAHWKTRAQEEQE